MAKASSQKFIARNRAPRVQIEYDVELTFESMDDFSPAAVARKVDALNKLLEARQQLSNLITYMDGKSGAEELVGKLLQDPTLLKTLAATRNEAAAKADTES